MTDRGRAPFGTTFILPVSHNFDQSLLWACASIGILIPYPMSNSSLEVLWAEMVLTFPFHYPCILFRLVLLQEGYLLSLRSTVSGYQQGQIGGHSHKKKKNRKYTQAAEIGRVPVGTSFIFLASSNSDQSLLWACV